MFVAGGGHAVVAALAVDAAADLYGLVLETFWVLSFYHDWYRNFALNLQPLWIAWGHRNLAKNLQPLWIAWGQSLNIACTSRPDAKSAVHLSGCLALVSGQCVFLVRRDEAIERMSSTARQAEDVQPHLILCT